MARLAYGPMLVAALALIVTGTGASAAPGRAGRQSYAAAHHHSGPHLHVGAHHRLGHHHGSPTTSPPVASAPHHPRVVSFVDGYEQPPIPHPYPFDGKLAGDGILHTGILDSNALRAFGIVRN